MFLKTKNLFRTLRAILGIFVFKKSETIITMDTDSNKRMDDLTKDFMEIVAPLIVPNIGREKWAISSGYSVCLSPDFVLDTSYEPKGRRFVHFTSVRALFSILNENAIRLYNLDNVNDPREYDYLAEKFDQSSELSLLKSDTFLFSLCCIDVLESSNILNLWRLYGDNGFGVVIEFEIIFFENNHVIRNYYFGNIDYAYSNKIDDIEKGLSEFYNKNHVSADISNVLRVFGCFIKSPYFKVEEETRLILARESLSMFDNDSFFQDINFRNELVEYHKIKLGVHKKDIPLIKIKRIQLGFRHSEESFKAIQMHLSKALIQNGCTKDELPIIEHSLLKNIYR